MNSIKIPAVKVNNAIIRTGAVDKNFVKSAMNLVLQTIDDQ
ncbi:hypothetical protein CWATWH0003_0041 [Crocosphaera watsonii WH 0003]|uniref:Uncharacterized protein n=1 Tax=Crocosphaera watsonii WH 0003 TaxID=423471 RepID=G5IXP2_CROWT|nr:hypothetical protein CWATWH0003_0041 [Crocosphaera watsonii WH 0003]